MDSLSWFLFITISTFFAGLIALLAKWTLGRFSTTLNSVPYSVLVLFILLVLVVLQLVGVDVAGAYRAFFRWLSGAFIISPFIISETQVFLIPVDGYWMTLPQIIVIYVIGVLTGAIFTYMLTKRRRR